ncbi:uncharacterized protein LOC108218580 [Daucus carota subsp. sativus]|uniref:uncharacterized protein LOC108218580 n=1 Tax=Daucus carota subsp. sativus TaxID=79200 RepID=UPI0007B2D38C|nr:PREDICTED: far upstream element-binding protein 2 [Daucus carota subsp. sativus]
MAQTQEEEIVLGTASPVTSDHKRKHDDLESDSLPLAPELNGNSEPDSVRKIDEVEDDSEAKRQRLDDKDDVSVTAAENGHQERENVPEEVGVESLTPAEDDQQVAEDEAATGEVAKQVNDEELAAEHQQYHAAHENDKLENAEEKAASDGEPLKNPEQVEAPSADISQQELVTSAQNQDMSEGKSMSRKMEVPNNKVGVLIGKAGDTIRYLQYNSGARIQITRDAEADPHSGSRPVELIGTLENIIKAEKLIKDVIAEADAGGSPALVARGFNTVQAAGAGEQIQIQVPNEKVGLIIGKGGETIKNLQTRSGARIQLIPQHLPEGDQSKERTVRVTGDKKQIELAREMIKEVMDQMVRPSSISGGYNQHQNSRPLGPAAHWGPRGHSSQQGGYDYQQRGPYQSHNQQYPHQPYGNYPPQQMGPRSNVGWEQRPHGPHGGYDYYGGPGHASDASKPIHTHAPGPSPMMGPPPSQPNYNYGQPQGGDYGQPPYSQTTPPVQSYGQGYNETKYDNQGAMQQPYGGHVAPQQPSAFPQGTAPGYGQQDQYGRPPSFGMPQQGPQVQSYGQPRAAQPANMPYQGPISSYGQAAPTQQPYPYASGGQMQQTYPPYSSAPAVDAYNQPLATAAAGYPQQGVQPVSGYGQAGVQQASGYAQAGTTGAYVQYPSSQPGYTEQAAPNTAAAYGAYQGTEDPAYSGAPAASYGAQPVVQPTYSQPATAQPVYDQSVPQSGGYATAPAAYR